MATNKNGYITIAKEAARKLNADQVIIVWRDSWGVRQVNLVTYGETVALCSDAARVGEEAYATARLFFDKQ